MTRLALLILSAIVLGSVVGGASMLETRYALEAV